MYFALLGVLLGVPAYYIARSKGRSEHWWIALVLAPSLVTWALPAFFPYLWLPPLGPAVSLVALGVLHLLPSLPGAKGDAYLKITFPCPECHKAISFPRVAEGTAELCPECGEVIRVQTDASSPVRTKRPRPRPAQASGPVCFTTYGREDSALLLKTLFAERDIDAQVVADDGGGVYGMSIGATGYRVVIDAAAWDAAVRVESEHARSLEESAGAK